MQKKNAMFVIEMFARKNESVIFLSLLPLLEITTRAFSWQIITH